MRRRLGLRTSGVGRPGPGHVRVDIESCFDKLVHLREPAPSLRGRCRLQCPRPFLEGLRIRSTELNWRDHEAVRAACKQAAYRLGGNLAEMEVFLDFELSSTTTDYRCVLDVVCMLASACPHLTKYVLIRDCTEPERSVPWREELSDLYVARFWR